MFLKYLHADLHDSNWKIVKYKDFYQLVIYDFGYVITNDTTDTYQKINYCCDIYDHCELGKMLYNNIVNNNISQKEFTDKLF